LTEILVLWDVDHTLVDAAGLGREAMEIGFRRVFGKEPTGWPGMAGRTDRWIINEVLTLNGVAHDEALLETWREAAEEAFAALRPQLVARGRALPGARDALVALQSEPVVQSLLTGNLRRFADVKMHAFGLHDQLDMEIGGYGWTHPVRAHLVEVARTAAAARHGRPFDGRSTVLVGDTPRDVEAALASGAAVVAVATGRSTMDDLAAAGAHAVLPDLTVTAEVLSAVRRVATAA
jgi:phosphoglycolate phosphatase